MYANQIYVLEKGCIVETATHHELAALKGLYYAMWRQQIGERKTIVPVTVNEDELIGWLTISNIDRKFTFPYR